MIKITSILILLFLFIPLHAQDRVFFSVNPGLSLYNSENSMKTIGDKKIRWMPGLSIGYEKDDLLGMNLYFGFDYTYSKVKNVLEFVSTTLGPEPTDTTGADLILQLNSFDAAIRFKLYKGLDILFGPTVSVVARSLITENFPPSPFESVSGNLDDRLVSVCVGLNFGARMEIPLSEDPRYFFVYSGFRLRYIHSIWFDDRGRKLLNYYQNFFIGHLNVGLGYNF
jgi:hypothetical protein